MVDATIEWDPQLLCWILNPGPSVTCILAQAGVYEEVTNCTDIVLMFF